MLKGLLNLLVLWVQNLIPAVAWTVKITAAIGKWVAANKILAGSLIVVGAAVAIATGGLSVIIPAILAIIAALTYFWRTSQMFRDHVTRAFSDVGQVLATVAIVIVRTLQGLALSILDTIGSIIHVIADIPIIGTKMRPLANAFDTAYKAVKNFSDGAVGKLKNFNDFVARMPKVVKLEGNISDLQNKLATANAALKNPNLTATRKARIEANIAQLTAAIAAAKAQLASINGDIAKTYIYTYNVNAGGFKNVATGGITGAAAGGVQGGWRMVGEHGRELIKTAPGSYVHSNPDTERIMSQGGGGPQRVVLEWARGAGTTDKIIAALQEAVRIRGGDPAMFERKVAFR